MRQLLRALERRRSRRLILAGTLIALAACGSSPSKSQPNSQLPPLPTGLTLIDVATPVGLTPDGRLALLQDPTSATVDLYFFDPATQTLTLATSAGEAGLDSAYGLSATGRIAATRGNPAQAALWNASTGWFDLASPFATGCDPMIGTAFDASDDGSVAVGLLWDGCDATAFLWTDSGGAGEMTVLATLGSLADGTSKVKPDNRASVVSGDGSVAAGFAMNVVDRSPAIWNADGTGFLLDPLNTTDPGEIKMLSSDGTLAAGDWGGAGFIWTQAAGVQRFTSADPDAMLIVNAASEDGRVAFGAIQKFDPDLLDYTYTAFVWTAAAGVRVLKDLVVANAVAVADTTKLAVVTGASSDGAVLLGQAVDPPDPSDPLGMPVTRSFLLSLPVSAYGL